MVSAFSGSFTDEGHVMGIVKLLTFPAVASQQLWQLLLETAIAVLGDQSAGGV